MEEAQIEAWNRQLQQAAAETADPLLKELMSQLKLERGLPPEEVEHQIRLASRIESLHRCELALLLVALEDSGGFRELSYDSIYEYASDCHGILHQETRKYLEVGRALQHLPQTRQAIADGIMSWETASLLSRVVTPDDEAEWLAWCRGRTHTAIKARVRSRLQARGR